MPIHEDLVFSSLLHFDIFDRVRFFGIGIARKNKINLTFGIKSPRNIHICFDNPIHIEVLTVVGQWLLWKYKSTVGSRRSPSLISPLYTDIRSKFSWCWCCPCHVPFKMRSMVISLHEHCVSIDPRVTSAVSPGKNCLLFSSISKITFGHWVHRSVKSFVLKSLFDINIIIIQKGFHRSDVVPML